MTGVLHRQDSLYIFSFSCRHVSESIICRCATSVPSHFSWYSQVTGRVKSQSQVFLLSASANEHKVIEVIKSRVLNFQVESHGIYFRSSQVLSHQNSDLSWLESTCLFICCSQISYSPFMLLKTGVFTLTISSHAWSFGKVVFGAFCFWWN